MVKSLQRAYGTGALIIIAYFLSKVSNDYYPIYVIHFLALVVYFISFDFLRRMHQSSYTVSRLSLHVFIYSLIFVGIYNYISAVYRGNFFVFSEADAVFYDMTAIKMATMSLFKSISYFLESHSFDDLGAVLVISTAYRFIESNLFLNFIYVVVGVFTALGIFRVSKHFISERYSYLCAFSYSVSSFVLWFHSSGLKESFMVFLVVQVFDQFYMFFQTKRIRHIVFASLFIVFLVIFRPAIAVFCVVSFLLSHLLLKRKGHLSTVIIILIAAVGLFAYPYFSAISERYMGGGSVEGMIAAKEAEDMVIGSLPFTYGVNILAASIGPLPTFIPNTKTMLSFFSVGLMFRVFLSLPFWLGVYYAYKRKLAIVYPLILFALMEMGSLTFILESLELRKSLSHMPAVFIVGFWFLDYYDKGYIDSSRKRKQIRVLSGISFIFFFSICFYWNLR